MMSHKLFNLSALALAIAGALTTPGTAFATITYRGNVTGTTSSPPPNGADWIDASNDITATETLPGIGGMFITSGSQLTANSLKFAGEGDLILSGAGTRATLGTILTDTSVSIGVSDGAVLNANNILLRLASSLIIGNNDVIGDAIAPGAVSIATLTLADTSKISFVHNSSNYIFDASILSNASGQGAIYVREGTTTLARTGNFSGSYLIDNGWTQNYATLLAGAPNALGQNATFEIRSKGTLDTNGYSQQLGSITNNGGNVIVQGATAGTRVNIANGYDGSGALTVTGRGVTLNVANGLVNRGTVAVRSGATLSADTLSNNNGALSVSNAGSALAVSGLFSNNGQTRFTDGARITADAVNNNGSVFTVSGNITNLQVRNQLSNLRTVQILDGATVSAGSLNNSSNLLLDGNGASLTVAGQLTSSRSIIVKNGSALTADNILINGTGTFAPSSLSLGSINGATASRAGRVNAREITLASTPVSRALIYVNHTDTDYDIDTRITGDGDIAVLSGVTTLSGINNYSGTTTVTGGMLRAGSDNTFSAASVWDIGSNGELDLNGYRQTLGDTTNAGTIRLSGATAGNVLTVDGNYTGNDGTLIFGTELDDDNARTDRLVVTGDAGGTTNIQVNNLGGRGAETVNGIELIEVQGSADSSAFRQQGRIVAGAYEYRLLRGNKNWYLTNRINLETGLPVIGEGGDNGGSGGDNGGGGGNGGGSDNGGGESVAVLRPEGSAYAANLATASTLFDTRMSDRQGTWYLDPLTGEQQYTSLWLRVAGDHNRQHAGDGQLRTRANSVVTLLGGDIAATDTARVGLMAGYGNSKSNTTSGITGYRARGQINGYTTGIYGTWFAEGTDEKGLWADSTLQYSWFNNQVEGEDEAGESYRSKGLSASLSSGYVIPLAQSERRAFFLQPQARIGWSGIKADDHTERNGTLVQGKGQDNVSSSLGVKAFMKSHAAQDDRNGRRFSLFTEANWIHNSREYAVRMDDVVVSQQGSRNIAEARVGVDGSLGGGLGLKGTIGQQVGDNSWSETQAAISVSYRF